MNDMKHLLWTAILTLAIAFTSSAQLYNPGEVLSYLKKLADAGIHICGQIVLCKGINDGDELQRSMNDLVSYVPALQSVSIVPAGKTKFRDKFKPEFKNK